MAERHFSTTELATERWKIIPGTEEHYSVSTLGRIRREKRACGTQEGFILTLSFDRCGYLRGELSVRGRIIRTSEHQAAMLAFVGPCPPGYEVNHKDGCKTNNRLDNLEYVTSKGNKEHAKRMGLTSHGAKHSAALINRSRGEKHYASILNAQEVGEIRQMLASGIQGVVIAQRFGVKPATISAIKVRRIWKHLI